MIKLKSLFRRGQTPSGSSKYGPGQQQQQQQLAGEGAPSAESSPLKGSSSTSNIDGLGLSKADRKKQQKEFGSRDHLDRKEHKSSKDRLVDNLRGHGKSKSAGKESKKPSKQEGSAGPMSIVQQQQQQQPQSAVVALSSAVGSQAYEHQRPPLSYGIVDGGALVKELTEINFDGPHSDAKSVQVQELRQQLDRVKNEKKVVEGQLAEMSVFQSEVMALRNEMSQMKVS